MKKANLALFALISLLLSILFAVQFLGEAQGNFLNPPYKYAPIYIREDGTIEGANESIQQNGNIYTLLKNLNAVIEIQRNNIIFNGNGLTLGRPSVAQKMIPQQ
jgi:hypothetical protein